MKRAPGISGFMVLLFAAASSGRPGHRIDAEPVSCGDERRDTSQPPQGFDETRYRPEDERVELIERHGYDGSRLFGGARVLVKPSQIAAILPRLTPGSQLILADGVWSNINVTIAANGTSSQPILIRPQSPGGVHFVGKTRIDIVGSHLIVADLTIRDGDYPTATTVLELGTSARPCNYCVAVGLHMLQLFAAPGAKLHFLGVRGKDATIAHSTFSGARSPGHFVYDSYPTEAGTPARLHVSHSLFSDRSAVSDENGYELLQLGESTVQAQSMYGRLEGNTFRNSVVPGRDTELITVKSSDWVIRGNRFESTVGSVSLRSTNRVLIEGNTFVGGGSSSGSGIRVQGAGHVIVSNDFTHNANPPPASSVNSAYYYSVLVPAGTVERVVDGEVGQPVAKDIVIAHNTFTGGRYNVHLGSFYPYYPLLPRRVRVFDNSIRTTQPLPIFVLPRGNEVLYLCNNTVENNVLQGAVTGLQGFLVPTANSHESPAVK